MQKIKIPGSKSVSNRALALAAISGQVVEIKNTLECDDTRFLREGLAKFGVGFSKIPGGWRVRGVEVLRGSGSEIFVGNGGTPARFLVAFSTILSGEFSLRGVNRMHERPFSDLFSAIEKLGVKIEFLEKRGFLPAKFRGAEGGCLQNRQEVRISGRVSSQFLSGLLLAGGRIGGGVKILVDGKIPSRPYAEMTVEMLKIFGVRVEVSANFREFEVFPGISAPSEFSVPGDSSSASYPVAWAILSGKSVEISNFGSRTMQGDEKFLEIVEKFGARVERDGEATRIFPEKKIRPLGAVNFEKMPDVAMTAIAISAFAEGVSEFSGLESLRVKECDRIEAMREGLEKIGAKIEVEGDRVRVFGSGDLEAGKKATINSFEDHRIAMVFGVLRATRGGNFEILDEKCVAKSWPDFWLDLAEWNGNLRRVSAVILRRESASSAPEFLIVKKPRKNHAWQFPQGGVDAGESSLEAARREIREECGAGLKFKLEPMPRGANRYFFPENFRRHEPEISGARVEFFCGKFLSGKVKVCGEEIVDFQWVRKAELGKFFDSEYAKGVSKFIDECGGGEHREM